LIDYLIKKIIPISALNIYKQKMAETNTCLKLLIFMGLLFFMLLLICRPQVYPSGYKNLFLSLEDDDQELSQLQTQSFFCKIDMDLENLSNPSYSCTVTNSSKRMKDTPCPPFILQILSWGYQNEARNYKAMVDNGELHNSTKVSSFHTLVLLKERLSWVSISTTAAALEEGYPSYLENLRNLTEKEDGGGGSPLINTATARNGNLKKLFCTGFEGYQEECDADEEFQAAYLEEVDWYGEILGAEAYYSRSTYQILKDIPVLRTEVVEVLTWEEDWSFEDMKEDLCDFSEMRELM
jgi:hypothetical protein